MCRTECSTVRRTAQWHLYLDRSPLAHSFSSPRTLHKAQYPAEGDVGKVTRFQEMMAQVPVTHSHKEHVRSSQLTAYVSHTLNCLSASLQTDFPYNVHVLCTLTFNNSTFCLHSVFMCFVWISEQTAIISLYSIN